MKIERRIPSPAAPEAVFAYLSDFTSTEQWDAGTVRTTRIEGDGGVGTRYANTSRFLGRETDLEYVVQEHDAPSRFVVVGRNKTVTAVDDLTVAPRAAGGSELIYRAEFTFHGAAKYVSLLLRPALGKLADGAEDGLRRELGRL